MPIGTAEFQLHNESLSRQVYDLIEAEIVTGRILPGTKLGEEALARRLGVSRSPVREALADLERAGFAERAGKRDRRVCVPDERFIFETYETLAIVEAGQTYLASLNATAEIHEECYRILNELRSAVERKDAADYARLNTGLHAAMVRSNSNRQVDQMVREHRKYVTWLKALYCQQIEEFNFVAIEQHRTIFEFYIKKDAGGLLHSLRIHLERQKERILRGWRTSLASVA